MSNLELQVVHLTNTPRREPHLSVVTRLFQPRGERAVKPGYASIEGHLSACSVDHHCCVSVKGNVSVHKG